MPSEKFLLFCPQCGRPQPAKASCVACGAPLPPPSNRPLGGRDLILKAYQPFLEADLGLERRILLSAKRFEWHPRSGDPVIAEVAQIERVRLLSRPVWESLAIGAAASLAVLLARGWVIRALLGAIVVLAVAACVLQKQYALVLTTRDGRSRRIDLGIGTRRAPVVQRIESVWGSLQPALKELGVGT